MQLVPMLNSSIPTPPAKPVLPRLTAPREAIEIEILFVDRPIGDPLLGDRLWSTVDQISSVPPETRLRLEQNGIKFGIVGSHPPVELQSLLNLTGQQAAEQEDDEHLLVGRRLTLRPSDNTEIETWTGYDHCQFEIEGSDGHQSEQFDQVRCVMRVQAERVQAGWARLQFQPEIHHGQNRPRSLPTPDELGAVAWQPKFAQIIETLYDHRFSVDLNRGEMVLITADEGDANSIGQNFFRGGEQGARSQRLLLVRLVSMPKVTVESTPF